MRDREKNTYEFNTYFNVTFRMVTHVARNYTCLHSASTSYLLVVKVHCFISIVVAFP